MVEVCTVLSPVSEQSAMQDVESVGLCRSLSLMHDDDEMSAYDYLPSCRPAPFVH